MRAHVNILVHSMLHSLRHKGFDYAFAAYRPSRIVLILLTGLKTVFKANELLLFISNIGPHAYTSIETPLTIEKLD